MTPERPPATPTDSPWDSYRQAPRFGMAPSIPPPVQSPMRRSKSQIRRGPRTDSRSPGATQIPRAAIYCSCLPSSKFAPHTLPLMPLRCPHIPAASVRLPFRQRHPEPQSLRSQCQTAPAVYCLPSCKHSLGWDSIQTPGAVQRYVRFLLLLDRVNLVNAGGRRAYRVEDHEGIKKCMHCRGAMSRGTAPFHIGRNGYRLSLDAVSAWACTPCGKPYFE